MTDKASTTPSNQGQASSRPSQASGSESKAPSTSGLVDEAKHALVNVAGLAADQAEQSVSGTKERAAEGLGSVVGALRATGEGFGGTSDTVKTYVDQAADQVERLSEYVRERDVVQIAGDVEKFARREPALFLGGAFVLGLCAARFLKSSSQTAQSSQGTQSAQPVQGPQGSKNGQNQARPQRQQLAARNS